MGIDYEAWKDLKGAYGGSNNQIKSMELQNAKMTFNLKMMEGEKSRIFVWVKNVAYEAWKALEDACGGSKDQIKFVKLQNSKRAFENIKMMNREKWNIFVWKLRMLLTRWPSMEKK